MAPVHLHLPKIQNQVYYLFAFLLLGLLLVSYRSQQADNAIHAAAYQLCLDRQAQAREINSTRANVGQLIINMVPNAPPQARADMLRGMTTTQIVHSENCDIWLQ